MKITSREKEKYRNFSTRYDLNYWYQSPDIWLEVEYYEFETEIDAIVRELIANNICSLSIITHGNNFLFDLSNLQHLDFVEHLGLSVGSYVNTCKINCLTKLKSLYIFGDNYGEILDLSGMQSLRRLKIGNSLRNIVGFNQLTELQTLSIQKYNSRDLLPLSRLRNLTSLELIQSKVESLTGIENFNNLQCLTMFYCSKLTSLKNIENLKNLEFVALRNCAKLVDYHCLGQCDKMKHLSIMTCGAMDNLQYLKSLHNLQSVGLVETNVLDGDVSPLIAVPWHGYTSKKHFNYYQNRKGEDIKRF